MNILILTGHFGLGHVRAAQAIKRAIERESSGVHVEIVDLFEHLSQKRSKKMYALFNFWTRYTPRLYNRLNAVSCHVNSLPLDKATFQKIDTLLIAHNTDMVISTLPFCTKCIGAYKQMTQKKLPLYTYITDVIAHEEWIAYGVDGYFVASGMTKKWIVSYGVKAEAVHVCGMPFIEVPSHHCAGEQKSSEPSERKKEILIMGGGQGLIPLDPPFFNELSQARDVHVTVIAGKNKKLKSKPWTQCNFFRDTSLASVGALYFGFNFTFAWGGGGQRGRFSFAVPCDLLWRASRRRYVAGAGHQFLPSCNPYRLCNCCAESNLSRAKAPKGN